MRRERESPRRERERMVERKWGPQERENKGGSAPSGSTHSAPFGGARPGRRPGGGAGRRRPPAKKEGAPAPSNSTQEGGFAPLQQREKGKGEFGFTLWW